MTIKHFVWVTPKNDVALALLLNTEDRLDEVFLAAVESGAKFFEIDQSIPADFGWTYDGETLKDPQGNIVTGSSNGLSKRLILVVEGDVATYLEFDPQHENNLTTSEDLINDPKVMEISSDLPVKRGWKYDGSTFFDPNVVA